jgi:hypothetical protein
VGSEPRISLKDGGPAHHLGTRKQGRADFLRGGRLAFSLNAVEYRRSLFGNGGGHPHIAKFR